MIITLGLRARSLTLSAVVLLGLTVAGCSGDDGDDGGDGDDAGAGVGDRACRTYLLAVAGDDRTAVQALRQAAETGSYTPDDLTTPLDAIIAAAAGAGGTTGLSDDDFGRYLAVAEAARTARTQVTAADTGLVEDTVTALDDAATAVREACDD